MALIRDVQSVKPICAVTFAPGVDLPEVTARLETLLGRVDLRSGIYAFDFTAYYSREMGGALRKQFLSFAALVHPRRLSAIKTATNAFEQEYLQEGNRRVNLDPGYVTPAKLVMASAKNFSHRIYLDRGIYGDLQLQYRDKMFHAQPWTFPDYRAEPAMRFFIDARNLLLNQE